MHKKINKVLHTSYFKQVLRTSYFILQRGFTLLEITVVVSMITLLTIILLANYRAGQGELSLRRSVQKMAQDIRRAEQMAMSAKECQNIIACPQGGVPAGGYGLYIYKYRIYDDTYFIYADSGNERYDSDEEIETIYLEKWVFISKLEPVSAKFSINFKPPDPVVKIKDQAGTDKEDVVISISLRANSARCKKIKVNKAGLIDIENNPSTCP